MTTMSGMDIKDFLLARIAEDEAEANWIDAEGDNGSSAIQHPSRIQAECAFKRWLIGTYSGTREAYLMFRAMATVYADHPDYLKEWRP